MCVQQQRRGRGGGGASGTMGSDSLACTNGVSSQLSAGGNHFPNFPGCLRGETVWLFHTELRQDAGGGGGGGAPS